MWGPSDPSDREPMIWKDLEPYDDPHVRFRHDVFDQYQRLIAIHRRLTALQLGFAHTVVADNENGVYSFSRDLGNDHICVVVNRSPYEREERLKFGPLDQNLALINWLDPKETRLSGTSAAERDSRSIITPIEGSTPAAIARHGIVNISLGPWGAMILSKPDVMTQ
jgi:hypothetical protein